MTASLDLNQLGLHADRWLIDSSPETVQLLPGVTGPRLVRSAGTLKALPPEMIASITEDEARAQLEVHAEFDDALGKYTLRHLALSHDGSEGVTGVLLRKIAPLRVLQWIVPLAFIVDAREAGPEILSYLNPPRSRRHPGVHEEPDARPSVHEVAAVYRLAEIVRDSPAKAVAKTLGLQRRTATNWIIRARERGLLG